MKPESVFGLEHAAWPALLVNAGGSILLANVAAKKALGAGAGGGSASLAAIWLPENGVSAADFMAQCAQTPSAVRRFMFRTASGGIAAYNTAVCAFSDHDGKRCYVLQLLPVSDVVGEAGSKAADGDTMVKQKLDCVLQLARTVCWISIML